MTVNLDPAAAIGILVGSPPLIGASLAMIAMLVLWLVSKVLKFAQMGLGAVAVVFLVRFVMSGGVDEVPTHAVNPSVEQTAKAGPTLGVTSFISGGEVRVDNTGFTFHVPLPGSQPVDAMLQSNQAQVQRVMAVPVPTEAPARN